MAAVERGDEVTFTGTTPVSRSRVGVSSSTLLAFTGRNPNGEAGDGSNNRTVIVRKKKASATKLELRRDVPPGAEFYFGPVVLVLDAADETVEFELSGAGTWEADASWLDR